MAREQTFLRDVAAGEHVANLIDPGTSGVNDIPFSPDGELLAMTDAGGYVHVRLVSELTS